MFPRNQEFYNVFAGITLPNTASVRFHESMGFTPINVYENVGFKDGDWHDVKWWHKRLRNHPSSPPSPRTVRELQHREEWDDAITAGLPSMQLHGKTAQ